VIDLANARVEASNAAEPRRKSNLVHGKTRLIDEFLGKVQTASLSYSYGRRAEVSQEQAAQVSCADSQAFRKNFDSTILQPTFPDQPQGSRNCV
jgi:hypothetical protein